MDDIRPGRANLAYKSNTLWYEVNTNRELVMCDDQCNSYEHPDTLIEAMATLDHYKNHSWMAGCSHGC